MYAHTDTPTREHYIHTDTHTDRQTYTHTHTHTDIHIHTHIHTHPRSGKYSHDDSSVILLHPGEHGLKCINILAVRSLFPVIHFLFTVNVLVTRRIINPF